MSCFTVQILEPSGKIIEVDTCVGNNVSSIVLENRTSPNIELSQCLAQLPADFNDIVFSAISGDILASSGINIIESGGKLYLSSLINATDGLFVNHNSGIYTISAVGLQPSGNYASGIHYHVSSDITDFNSSVSGLINTSLSLSGVSGVTVTKNNSNYLVSLTDPIIHLHDISNLSIDARNFLLTPNSANLGTLITDETGVGQLTFNVSPRFLGIPLTPTAVAGTNTDQIASTKFVRTEVSNLVNSAPSSLDTLKELAQALGNDPNFASTVISLISGKVSKNGDTMLGPLTGPSGNFTQRLSVNNVPVSVSGHTHTSSNITDFNSSVSGLLNITDVLAGSNISISKNGTIYTINVSGQLGLTSEEVDDRVASLLNAGSGISINYDDDNNILTISTSGLQPSGNYASSQHASNHSVTGNDPITIGLEQVTDFSGNVLGGDGTPVNTFLSNLAVNSWQDAFESVGGTLKIGMDSGRLVLTEQDGYLTTSAGISSNFITDFNTSVSGLLPTIANSGNNRVLTSIGNSFDINAESNLTFDGSLLSVNSSGFFTSGIFLGSQSTIGNIGGQYIHFEEGLIFLKRIDNSTAISLEEDILVSNDGTLSLGWTDRRLYGVDNNVVLSWAEANKIGILNQSPQYTLDVTGSGNFSSGLYVNGTGVSVSGHTHLANNITNFNSSVSGLLPVKNIIGGSGIQVGSISGEYTITAAGLAAASASSLITEVYNNTSSTIPKMSVVYINGGQGNLPTIQLAIANGEAGSSKTYGITAEAIGPQNNGDVVIMGALIDLNTNQFGASEGSTLYLSPTVSGGITTIKPLAPNHLVSVGTIVRNHNNQGVIEVRIQNGFELYELHDVKVSGVTDGQFLQYNSASGLWFPSSSGNFTNLTLNNTTVSVSGHTHVSNDITNFNSSVSGLLPVKNILAGTNISINNTAGDYTISVSGNLGLTTEEVDDRVASLLVAGSGINLNYNDNSNSLTISTLNNKILSDVVGSTNYIGVAPYNSLSSAEVWKIYKTIYLSDGGVSSNTSANNVAWDNRYSVTYS